MGFIVARIVVVFVKNIKVSVKVIRELSQWSARSLLSVFAGRSDSSEKSTVSLGEPCKSTTDAVNRAVQYLRRLKTGPTPSQVQESMPRTSILIKCAKCNLCNKEKTGLCSKLKDVIVLSSAHPHRQSERTIPHAYIHSCEICEHATHNTHRKE